MSCKSCGILRLGARLKDKDGKKSVHCRIGILLDRLCLRVGGKAVRGWVIAGDTFQYDLLDP
jgi:hypothetical protein